MSHCRLIINARYVAQVVAIVSAVAPVSVAGNRPRQNFRYVAHRAGSYSARRFARSFARGQFLSRATTAEATMLRQSYGILSKSKEDFQGHRVQAMKAVQAAAKTLHVSLRGVSQQQAPAAAPDIRLRQAQGMLQQVQISVAGRNQQRVAMQIDVALQHITTALAVK